MGRQVIEGRNGRNLELFYTGLRFSVVNFLVQNGISSKNLKNAFILICFQCFNKFKQKKI
jgi:hypothetical protein